MTTNYVSTIVKLEYAQRDLSKAQRDNNTALMISIADRIARLANSIATDLEETVA